MIKLSEMYGMTISRTIWLGMFFTLVLSSCAGLKKSQPESQLVKSNCNQTATYQYTKEDLPRAFHDITLDSTLIHRFSSQSLYVANALGILDQLAEYLKLVEENRINPTIENRINIVEHLQTIYQRINISSLEISAVASEIDCEEERADQIASYLKGNQTNTETKLTVGAIVIGAAGAITTGILLANGFTGNVPEIIGIGTGLTEATLGILILLNKKKVEYYHPRNVLNDIWSAPETSTIFPASIWYYLNYEHPDKGEKSLRQQLVDKWLAFGQIADTKEKNKDEIYNLFFEKGGKYSADQLTNRANMLDQIESQIKLMKQDLLQLGSELEN